MKKIVRTSHYSVSLLIFTGLFLFSCQKCNDCKECELNPNTGQFDKNCSEYKEYCGSDLKVREETDIFHCN